MARQFALRGCKKLFLVDISLPGLEKTLSLIERDARATQVTLCQTDITSELEVENMVRKCVEAYGRIDFASNNAGIGTVNVKTADMTVEQFDRICNVNEKGVSNFSFLLAVSLSSNRKAAVANKPGFLLREA